MKKNSFCKKNIRHECGRLCSQDKITHLMTRLALIEGSIIEKLEDEKAMTLRELMKDVEWEPCAVSMAIGSLIRQGMVRCREYDKHVLLEYGPKTKTNQAKNDKVRS